MLWVISTTKWKLPKILTLTLCTADLYITQASVCNNAFDMTFACKYYQPVVIKYVSVDIKSTIILLYWKNT